VATLHDGLELAVPTRLEEGLADAHLADLAEIEITPSGLAGESRLGSSWLVKTEKQRHQTVSATREPKGSRNVHPLCDQFSKRDCPVRVGAALARTHETGVRNVLVVLTVSY